MSKRPGKPKRPRVPAHKRRHSDQIEMFLAQYTAAAGQGALVELRMRMLCEVIPETARKAHDVSYQVVEDAVCGWLEAHGRVTPAERKQLTACRALRNKLFHANFLRARERLEETGATPGRAGVFSIPIPENPADLIEALTERRGAQLVAESGNKRQIFGWLLELGGSGDFVKAEAEFRRADRLVDALADRVTEIALAERGLSRASA